MNEKKTIEQELVACYRAVSGCDQFAMCLFKTEHFTSDLIDRITTAIELLSNDQLYRIIQGLDGQKLLTAKPLSQVSEGQFNIQKQAVIKKLAAKIQPVEHDIHRRHANVWGTVSICNSRL